MLTIDADSVARSLVTNFELSITGTASMGASSTFDTTEMPVDGQGWPYEYALVPRDGDSTRTYRIVATAYQNEKKIAVLRTESGFIKRRTLQLSLRFDAGCLHEASLKCSDSETCVDKSCVPARLNADDLPPLPEGDGDGGPGIITGVPPIGTVGSPSMGSGAGGGRAGASGGGSGGSGAAGAAGEPGVSVGTANCGDGVVGGGEACDTAITAGAQGACPTSCTPSSSCEANVLEGSACQARCRPTPITTAIPGDGCCPDGIDANNDSDCAAVCGNSIVESGETCDPVSSCPTPESCQPAGACLRPVLMGDPNACNFSCQMEMITACQNSDGCCPDICDRFNDNDCSAMCGDGIVDPLLLETCEPTSSVAPCPESCDDRNGCTLDFTTGSARNCNTVCFHIPILTPINRDGCCPPNANANNDNDCTPMCGNGVTESGERCDANCPTSEASCNDDDACTRDTVSGSECGRQCVNTRLTADATRMDGCCPGGATPATDMDCAGCGNGRVEAGETCDGNCPTTCNDNNGCTNDRLVGSGCQVECETEPACHADATCMGTTCRCRAGFTGNGTSTCTDVNECTMGLCDDNASCENTAGSFECTCNRGYSGNGMTCANIDECANGTHTCDANEMCDDTDGSFMCTPIPDPPDPPPADPPPEQQ